MAWNRPAGNHHIEVKRPKKRALVGGAVCGAIVVIGGLVAFLVISASSKTETTKDEKRQGRIAEVKPSLPKTEPVKTQAVETVKEVDPSKKIVAVTSCVTNKGMGTINMVVKTADGKTHREIHYLPPPFNYGTDMMLSAVLNPNKGGGTIPMPVSLSRNKDLDNEFRKSLEEPIVINPDDSPRLQENKRKVMEAREQIKELMDQGLHFAEIIEEHKRLLQENAEIRKKAVKELMELHKAGDKEGERQYQVTIDAALQSMGIDPLPNLDEIERVRAERDAKKLEKKENNQ